jgi:hypothetical protein
MTKCCISFHFVSKPDCSQLLKEWSLAIQVDVYPRTVRGILTTQITYLSNGLTEIFGEKDGLDFHAKLWYWKTFQSGMNNKCLGLYKSTWEKHFLQSVTFSVMNYGFFRRNVSLVSL